MLMKSNDSLFGTPHKITRERLMERGKNLKMTDVPDSPKMPPDKPASETLSLLPAAKPLNTEKLPSALSYTPPVIPVKNISIANIASTSPQPPAIMPPPPQKIIQPEKVVSGALLSVIHHEISKNEDDNLGLQAAHAAESAGEKTIKQAAKAPGKKDLPPEANPIKWNHYTRRKGEDNLLKAVKDPNANKVIQKKRIKKKYAASARKASEAKKTTAAAAKTGKATASAVGNVAKAASAHPVVFGILILIIILLMLAFGMFSSCSDLGGSGIASILSTTYLAEDEDINNAELNYSKWEAETQVKIENTQADYPGYDEYRYSTGDIGHNPFELLAYLTVMYQDFKYPQIESNLRALFDQQYSLSFVPSVETRTRTVEKTGTRTVTDPETGEEHDEDYSYTGEESYDWHVMTVTLSARSFTDVISEMMNDTQKETYGLLMTGKGNRQYAANPLRYNWLPNVTETYGYYDNNGQVSFSDGVSVSVSQGSDVYAGFDGTVSDVGSNYIVLTDKYGISVDYGNMGTITPGVNETVKSQDLIGVTGNTLRLTVSNGNTSLNPLIFIETGSGTPEGINYGDPGEPMSAEKYNALMAVARLQLGKPYKFGASGPDSFDCSGYVCYALNHSGVAAVGRTTAQGLFNMCVPISSEDAQPGDLIFFQGTYSTVNTVTHVGIYLGDGMMINAGDPVKYANINTPYWQQHFYSFARVPTSTSS